MSRMFLFLYLNLSSMLLAKGTSARSGPGVAQHCLKSFLWPIFESPLFFASCGIIEQKRMSNTCYAIVICISPSIRAFAVPSSLLLRKAPSMRGFSGLVKEPPIIELILCLHRIVLDARARSIFLSCFHIEINPQLFL